MNSFFFAANSDLASTASLFQCEAAILKRALSSRTISTGVGNRQSIINVPLDANQVSDELVIFDKKTH
jgi:hypothetical protein